MRKIDVRKHRRRVGLTQIGLARKLNVAQSTVAGWESGRSQPMAGYLPDMAEVFECRIDDLYEPAGSDRGVQLIFVESPKEFTWEFRDEDEPGNDGTYIW